MSIMTVEYLARLGRERTISSLFERAWRGKSPVVIAMQIVENKRKKRNREASLLALLALCIPFAFAFTGFVNHKGDIDAMFTMYMVEGGLLVLAALGILIARESKGRKVGGDEEAMVNRFCEHLVLVSEWTNYNSFASYPYDDEDEIKKHGTTILVKTAIEVLRLQRKEKEAESEKTREQYQEMAGREMAEFSKRYDTLKRIGLASGGYDKYFEAARKLSEKNPG